MTSARAAAAHLPVNVVRRQRLVDAMGRPGARLVIVTGPAGSGKTVAVRDWVGTCATPSAWMSLDRRDTDPEHFLESLLTTLESLAPGVHDAAWRREPGDRAADRAVDRAVAHLADGPPSNLVLDDLHVVDRSPTAAMFARFVEVLPATNLRLVVCSRSDPPLHLHRFRLAGELVELRESDLRFVPEEVDEFFDRFPQVDIGAAHVEQLAARTEGWAAGLQFAALSLAGRDDAGAFVERFAGSDRHIADFLLDEVLDRQPDEIRDFLLRTSVLARLRGDLCAEVTGNPDAAGLLRRVEAEHLFLVPLDDDREWFRYHHLFSQLLRRELRMTCPELEVRGHERAAAWFAAHGQRGHAVDHLLDADRLDDAFDLIATLLGDYVSWGRHETLRGWLVRLPDEFVDATPDRQVVVILAYVRSGLVQRARATLDRARAAGRCDPAGDGATAHLHYAAVEAALAASLGDPETALARGGEAWHRRSEAIPDAGASGMARAADMAWGHLPASLVQASALLDDQRATHRWSLLVRRQGPQLPADLVCTLGAEAWAEARRGRLRSAAELADEALALAADHGRGARRALIGARITLALVHRERDELDEALGVLEPHLAPARQEGHVALATLGEIELARTERAAGRPADAVARLLRTRRERAAWGTPAFLTDVLDRAECRVRLHMADLDRAGDLLEEIASGPERRLLEARAALVANRRDEVGPLLDDAHFGDEARRWWFESAALRARALVEDGDLATARQVLGEVAGAAWREGAVRTFLDEGFDIGDLVDVAGRDGSEHRVVARAGAGHELVEPLSARELSVLRYLPSRMSNREIGGELYVSLNTVKSHLKAIYRKLGVDRRDDAVRRARQLGLL